MVVVVVKLCTWNIMNTTLDSWDVDNINFWEETKIL